MNNRQMADLFMALVAAQKLCERMRGVEAFEGDWFLIQSHVDDLWDLWIKHGGDL